MFQSHDRKSLLNRNQKAGFTLIELLITISIIAVLASIILPAVNGARRAARVAAVRAEMAEIAQALDQFKAEFGMYPPSSITLYETAADWNINDAVHKKNKFLVSKLWPDYDFATRDLDGDGTAGEEIVLQPAECLVFFLGGPTILDTSINKFTPLGFANDPTNPFNLTSKSRKAPYFKFDISRLRDGANANNLPAYIDNYPEQELPILYFSGNGSAGYDHDQVVATGLLDVYRQSWTLGTTATATFDPSSTNVKTWNDSTFQLISPGPDKQYGIGGYFASGMAQPSPVPAAWGDFNSRRQPDIDNITNFHNSELR